MPDIAPGANYMDRKRCYSIYFYNINECWDCHMLEKCKEQHDKEKKKHNEKK